MKYAKYVIAIKGEPILLRAFAEKAKTLEWNIEDVWKLTNVHCIKVFWDVNGCKSSLTSLNIELINSNEKVYTLPKDWESAIEAIRK